MLGRAAGPVTGFSAAVKLACRTRAGGGSAEDALCEACGRWLGRHGGQVHHRINRQMGGSRFRNTIVHAALLCGDPFTGCHGAATRLSGRMKAMGFVLLSTQDPAAEPVMLHGEQGGATVWLTKDGRYSAARPGDVAA